ncbi:hypothetical protein LJC31_05420 [Synergistaceae bacterium OttesenSCG-928-I11]|nr:hypothetical protein [Synergistaceae bacterium OttesenSCG-928-I11]
MSVKKYDEPKHRRIAFFSLCMFLYQLFVPVGAVLAEAGFDTLNVVAPAKSDVMLDDADVELAKVRKANVLFFLDTSNTMGFSPKGLQPNVVLKSSLTNNVDAANWEATENAFGYGKEEVVEMMQYATFGSGQLPPANSSKSSTATGYTVCKDKDGKYVEANMYGRDVDPKNNFRTGDSTYKIEEHYYFPLSCDESKEPLYSLYGFTYSDTDDTKITMQHLFQRETAFQDLHKKAVDGDDSDFVYNYGEIPSGSLPYALVFKNPKHWKKPPETFNTVDLVPNDSRMYQMKLALWNLLEDPANFENIRFGMANGYSSPTYVPSPAMTTYKGYPYGGTESGETPLAPYVHGTSGYTITGQPQNLSGTNSQSYVIWANNTTGALYPTSGTDEEKNAYRVVRRGYLKLPFAEYSKVWKKERQGEITHAQKFRLWIDGVEDIRRPGNDYYFYRFFNPELKITGNLPLAMIMYPDPKLEGEANLDWYRKSGYIWYSSRTTKLEYSAPKPIKQTAIADFMSGSGEAVGSVRDFFSPYIKGLNSKGEPVDGSWKSSSPKASITDLDPISFPIQDECEDNWVVVITSGSEIKATNADPYLAEDAIANLYHSTNYATEGKANKSGVIYEPLHKVKELNANGSIKSFEEVNPNKPIRTLVIGFLASTDQVPAEDVTARENIKFMHERLHSMARAGQSGNPDETPENKHFKATIVDNPLELYKALQDAFKLINSDLEQPEKGTMTEGAPVDLDDDKEQMNLYSAGYRIVNSNQWQGALRRYSTFKRDDGTLEVKSKAEMGKRLLADRNEGVADRDIQYWSVSSKKFMPLLKGNTGDNGEFAKLTGLQVGKIRARGEPWSIDNTPAEAFRQWLLGYDFSYENYKAGGNEDEYLFPRDYMLADFGQSGLVIAGPPKWANSLPGYGPWTHTQADRATRLYGQTNDGILHVIEPVNLKETKALLVPPVLLPTRLAATKTSSPTDGTRAWVDVEKEDDPKELSPDVRSRPLYLLDGPLQLRHFDLTSGGQASDWGSYLVAPLGRAGNGIYMMDVNNPDSPKFMWYRETVVDGNTGTDTDSFTSKISSVSLNATETALTVATGQSINWKSDLTDDKTSNGFKQLGFNSPKPALSVVGEVLTGVDNRSFHLQNVIILPGGMKSKLEKDTNGLEKYNGTEGAALFIIDPKDGTLLKMFNSHSDNIKDASAPIATTAPAMGMMISEPSLYRSDLNAYVTSKAFVADNLGRIFMINFGDDTDLARDSSHEPGVWEISLLASLQKNKNAVDGNFAIPHGVAIYRKNNLLWIAGGTANVGTRNNDANNSAMLENGSQVIFAFNTEARTDSATQYRDMGDGKGWKELAWNGNVDDVLNPMNDVGKTGWFFGLEKRTKYKDEYVSTKPVIINGTLYVATYMDEIIKNAEKGKCGERNMNGISKLYAIDVATGAPVLWEGATKKAQEFGGIKITGLTHSKQGTRETLVVTYDTVDTDPNKKDDVKDVAYKEDKMNMPSSGAEKVPFFTIDEGAVKGAKMKSASSVINYWREK